MKKVAIVGAGAIARRLMDRLGAQGHKIVFSVRRRTRKRFGDLLSHHKPHAVFLAISTLDKGEAARDYMLACAKAGTPIITCEKGALSYHAKSLQKHMGRIGYSAAVGGGTLMLPYARARYLNNEHTDIQAVLNGTLNFVFDEMGRGRGLGEACAEATKLGYAEPGADDPLSLINGELADVVRKTCVFYNVVLARSKYLTPGTLGSITQTGHDLDKLSKGGGGSRLVISFTKDRGDAPEFLGRSFSTVIEGWRIHGGFRKIDASQLDWLPGGVGNVIRIVEGKLGVGGKYRLEGPGAGPVPTTSAMIADFRELCSIS